MKNMNADVEVARWGIWQLKEGSVLRCGNFSLSGVGFYEIELDRMTSRAEMLDTIFQVANKNWITSEAIGDLVRALDDLLDPQAHLCSGGGYSWQRRCDHSTLCRRH